MCCDSNSCATNVRHVSNTWAGRGSARSDARVTSVEHMTDLGPRRFTRREAGQSEGAARAALECFNTSASTRALKYERSNTSAERSEARENDVGRSATFRVASPLVMATRSSHQSEQIAKQVASTPIRAWRVVGTCQPSHYLLLRKGVVPHETTSDSHVVHSGFAPLRLRRGARSPHACHTMKRALRKPQGACV
jgi:hypothetical protein